VTVDRAGAFARLLERVREGAYVGTLGADGGRTIAANAHLKEIFGFSQNIPDNQIDPFADERFVDPGARAAFLDALRTSAHVCDHQLRMRRLDGSFAWIEVTGSAAPAGAEPDSLEVVALLRDVSERRQSEDRSRELHQQLQQAERLASLGQTISGVAHELNNPLATILSWAERLAERPADEKMRRGLDVIRSESERAARIVRNLLTFARKRQTTRLMIDLNDIVRETMALRAYEQRVSNITVRMELAPSLPLIFADGYQIKQVLLNLVINAEQAMIGARGSGTLTIRTRHDPDHDSAVVEVQDDGPGISEEVQARIFDPFYTTKEVGKGTGLGLSVAYAIVHEHSGRIWVSSEPGRGAAFFVELPAGNQYPARTRPAEPVSLDEFQGRRVLVIEDEPALATALTEALADSGFVVERAADGEEGLIAVAQHPYDLVVCDLKMPRLDGMQFYRAMAAATPSLVRRVIFVTGAVAGTDAEEFLEETGCRWLAKPFRLADLLRAAREALS
jgi:two-component system cell cycle sensor histidine kinase/response regulator CckA